MTKMHMPPTPQTAAKPGFGRWIRRGMILAALLGAYGASCAVVGVGMKEPIRQIMQLI